MTDRLERYSHGHEDVRFVVDDQDPAHEAFRRWTLNWAPAWSEPA